MSYLIMYYSLLHNKSSKLVSESIQRIHKPVTCIRVTYFNKVFILLKLPHRVSVHISNVLHYIIVLEHIACDILNFIDKDYCTQFK